jgi:hypothetical protein
MVLKTDGKCPDDQTDDRFFEKAAITNRSVHFYGNDFVRPSQNFLRIWKTINEYMPLSI